MGKKIPKKITPKSKAISQKKAQPASRNNKTPKQTKRLKEEIQEEVIPIVYFLELSQRVSKPTIGIVNQYGLFYYWYLIAFGQVFYLGQDKEFCRKVLSMELIDVAIETGGGDLGKPKVREKLAQFIIDKLQLTKGNTDALRP